MVASRIPDARVFFAERTPPISAQCILVSYILSCPNKGVKAPKNMLN